MISSADTLSMARFARGVGDADGCLRLSDAAVRQAEFEHEYVTAYWAAETPARMYMGRAEPHLALPRYRYALDLALMHGLSCRLGGAYHDLALAERESGNRDLFRQHAATAHSLYRDTDARTPCLTGLRADMAADDWERDPSNPDRAVAALSAWRAVPGCMKTPRYRLAAAAQQMVTSAALKLPPCYESGADTLETILGTMPDGEAVAMILVYASGGALAMKDFPRAASLAEKAESLAARRGEDVLAAQAGAAKEAANAEWPRAKD